MICPFRSAANGVGFRFPSPPRCESPADRCGMLGAAERIEQTLMLATIASIIEDYCRPVVTELVGSPAVDFQRATRKRHLRGGTVQRCRQQSGDRFHFTGGRPAVLSGNHRRCNEAPIAWSRCRLGSRVDRGQNLQAFASPIQHRQSHFAPCLDPVNRKNTPEDRVETSRVTITSGTYHLENKSARRRRPSSYHEAAPSGNTSVDSVRGAPGIHSPARAAPEFRNPSKRERRK